MNQHEADVIAVGGGGTWRTITLIVMALLGAAVLVALISTLSSANSERDRALRLQAHSYDVMILARTLSSTIARSEASLGRYVISADKQLGRLYFEEWVLAGTQINRLETLTFDNKEQRARVAELRRAYETRGRELSLTALSTNYGKNAQAIARYYQGRNAPTLIAINRTLDQLIARERALLDNRTAGALGSVERSSSIAGVLAVFGMLIVLGAIGLGWFTIRAVGDRLVAQADADMERGRAEELTAAVEQATTELRIQEAKLRQIQKMDAVGQLTGGIAHDFNNMLAVVLGGLELAARSIVRDPKASRRHIESATDGANRAAALTRQLLAFSREDALRPETLGIAGLVEDMSDLLDRTLGDAITLTAVDRSDGWRVRADRVQLENAVLNLAVNARDAMNGRGTMIVTTGAVALAANTIGHCPAGDYATIAVSDDGSGMPPDVAERVFEPFFTTKEKGKGTGLGLSQIFGLVRQLGGEVEVVSAVDEGTTVTLYLPRDSSDAVAETGLPHTPRDLGQKRDASDVSLEDGDGVSYAPDAAEADARPLRILVVEDDPRVLAATIGALEELGHDPISCDDPVNAAALLARHGAVDLIISDVLMPRQTGPEMIAALRPIFPDVAVLYVTGFAGESGTNEFGDDHVLRKPFTLAGLDRAVIAAMASGRPSPPRQIAAE